MGSERQQASSKQTPTKVYPPAPKSAAAARDRAARLAQSDPFGSGPAAPSLPGADRAARVAAHAPRAPSATVDVDGEVSR